MRLLLLYHLKPQPHFNTVVTVITALMSWGGTSRLCIHHQLPSSYCGVGSTSCAGASASWLVLCCCSLVGAAFRFVAFLCVSGLPAVGPAGGCGFVYVVQRVQRVEALEKPPCVCVSATSYNIWRSAHVQCTERRVAVMK